MRPFDGGGAITPCRLAGGGAGRARHATADERFDTGERDGEAAANVIHGDGEAAGDIAFQSVRRGGGGYGHIAVPGVRCGAAQVGKDAGAAGGKAGEAEGFGALGGDGAGATQRAAEGALRPGEDTPGGDGGFEGGEGIAQGGDVKVGTHTATDADGPEDALAGDDFEGVEEDLAALHGILEGGGEAGSASGHAEGPE